MSTGDTSSEDFDRADQTVEMGPSPAKMWQPGPSLAARVTPRGDRSVIPAGRDPRLIAGVILIAALAIGLSLWIAALLLQSADDSESDLPSQSEPAMSILDDMMTSEATDA